MVVSGNLVTRCAAATVFHVTLGIILTTFCIAIAVEDRVSRLGIFRPGSCEVMFKFIGTAFPFALKLVELLLGTEKRNEVQGPMVFPTGAI